MFDISKNKNKIFCISFQRTGTTSIGQFFKDFGYKVAGYDSKRSSHWSYLRFTGDCDSIFKSSEFKKHQVFEDNPWWEEDFYKLLFHRFPKAKFILFTRDADKWFDSMVSHSIGKTLGNTFRHSKIYRREYEYYKKFPDLDHYKSIKKNDKLLDLNDSHRKHYKDIYNLRNKEIVDFFEAFCPESLFVCQLEDDDKWLKLGNFFQIKVPNGYEVHLNKTRN